MIKATVFKHHNTKLSSKYPFEHGVNNNKYSLITFSRVCRESICANFTKFLQACQNITAFTIGTNVNVEHLCRSFLSNISVEHFCRNIFVEHLCQTFMSNINVKHLCRIIVSNNCVEQK